jgi:hypothetical protein
LLLSGWNVNAPPSVGEGVREEEEEEEEAVDVARMSNLDAFSNGGDSKPEQPSELPLPLLLESAVSAEELLALRELYPVGGLPAKRGGGGGCRRGGSEEAAGRPVGTNGGVGFDATVGCDSTGAATDATTVVGTAA